LNSFAKDHQAKIDNLVDGNKVTFTYAAGRRAGKTRTVRFAGKFNKGDRTGVGKGTFRCAGFFGYDTEGPEVETKKSFHWEKTKILTIAEGAGEKAKTPKERQQPTSNPGGEAEAEKKIEGNKEEKKPEEKTEESKQVRKPLTLEDFDDSDLGL
jgi:hypothetical protein